MSLNARSKLPMLMASLFAWLLCAEVTRAQGLLHEFVQRVQQARASPESNGYTPLVFKTLGIDLERLMHQCSREALQRSFRQGFGHQSLPPPSASVGHKGIAPFIPVKMTA